MFEIDPTAMDEIQKSTDRASAIIAGSYLEVQLKSALYQNFVRDKTIFEKLFSTSGPLSAFETKIRIAYLTGLISKPFHDDLLILKDVRNKFAHRLDIKTFDEQTIRDKLSNLAHLTVGISALELLYRREATHRERFESAVGEAAGMLSFRCAPRMPDPVY